MIAANVVHSMEARQHANNLAAQLAKKLNVSLEAATGVLMCSLYGASPEGIAKRLNAGPEPERAGRKQGLVDAQISADRDRRARALRRQVADPGAAFHAHKDFTKVPVGYVHAELSTAREEQRQWANNRLASIFQGKRLSYTERGDFTTCFRRGI